MFAENKIIIIILVTIFAASSCTREAYNISYKGVIVDEETNCPLPYSSIQSFCLYQQNIDESNVQQYNTHTDSLGNFQLNFNKGYKISLSVEAEHYMESFVQFKPHASQAPDTIYLKRKLMLQSSNAKKTVQY